MTAPVHLTLSDGRRLEFWSEGPDDGRPALFHHGTPASGLPYEPFVTEAARRGLRLISYSRPGYGTSDRHEGRTVAHCAPDVRELLDHLAIDRCLTLGWSGGGPHTVACAALLADRVDAAAVLAGAAPYGADGLDFLEGMGRENVEEFEASIGGPEALRAWMEEHAPEVAKVTGDSIVDALGDLVWDVDRASVTAEFGSYLADATGDALREGWWGWFDDDVEFVSPWGFDVASVSVPVAIWHGGQDRMAPFGHGRWLATNVPNARPRLRPEEGHLSLVIGSFGEILDDLVSLAEGS